MTALNKGPIVSAGDVSPAYFAKLLAEEETVYLEKGTFTLDDTIEINERFHLVGSGSDETIIKWTGSGPAFACTNSGQAGGVMRDLKILGANSYVSAASGSIGVRLGQATGSPASAQVHMENVFIKGFEKGISAEASVIGRFLHVITQQCTTGFTTEATRRSIQNTFYGCRWEQNLLGTRLGNCEEILFSGCIWQNNYGRALNVGQHAEGLTCQNIRFDMPYFEANCTTTDQTNSGAVLVQSDYTSATRNIVFVDALVSGNNSDYDFEFGDNEGVFMGGFPYSTAPTIKAPTTGTPVRTYSPMRAAAMYWNRGAEGTDFGFRYTADDGDTTPNVHKGDTCVVNYTSPTTITGLGTYNLTSHDGFRARLEIQSTNITMQHGTGAGNCKLVGSTNWSPSYPAVMEFELVGGVWVEMSRSWLGGGGGTGSPYP